MALIMAIVMASAMAIIYPGPFFAFGKKLCETEILNVMESALKNAGGEDYYLTPAGKEDFLKSLNPKITECYQKGFLPSSKRIKVNNLNFEFQIDGDYIKIVRREGEWNRVAELTANGDVQAFSANAEIRNDAKECIRNKLSGECISHGQYLPAQAKLLHETGYEIYDCTFEISVNVNSYVTFSNWRWYHWFYFWKLFSSSQQKFTARYVLSAIEGWDYSKGTAKIELQCNVETEHDIIGSV